jgi:hypothetical protein
MPLAQLTHRGCRDRIYHRPALRKRDVHLKNLQDVFNRKVDRSISLLIDIADRLTTRGRW